MSTRSLIALGTPYNTFTSIYCHYNGHPWLNGEILRDHYATTQLVERLLQGGNLSILGTVIGQYNFFKNPGEDVCLYYHRDRGDPWDECKPQYYTELEHLIERMPAIDYVYVFWIDLQKWCYYEWTKHVNHQKKLWKNVYYRSPTFL